MDTVVATEAAAPRRRGTKFKLTYLQICELSVAKGPVEGPQGRITIAPWPAAEAGGPIGSWMATKERPPALVST